MRSFVAVLVPFSFIAAGLALPARNCSTLNARIAVAFELTMTGIEFDGVQCAERKPGWVAVQLSCRKVQSLHSVAPLAEPATWVDVGRPLPTRSEVASTDSADYGRPRSTDLNPGKQTLPM
ncbi:hypothetical protein B0H13DRAFT_1876354 [Mycena leptocephala]|nr:hypothetical protein B0H13DRAFT_1876354 [Mycena leptocephala]